jgi:hypothetical protein
MAEEKPASGPSEGIKVHGYWTIEIRNPDGSVVSHQEFENSLMSEGRSFLAQLLGRATTVTHWYIDSGLFCAVPGRPTDDPRPCYIGEPVGPERTARVFPTLTVTVMGDTLELSGSMTAENAGTINRVEVVLDSVDFGATFSGKDLSPNSVAVAAGQIVQIKVVYSFS